jgi:hypothetical protein
MIPDSSLVSLRLTSFAQRKKALGQCKSNNRAMHKFLAVGALERGVRREFNGC